jgi:hypothetical protein
MHCSLQGLLPYSSVTSFGNNRIEYCKVHLAPPLKPMLTLSIWPSLQEACGICESLAIPKTAKNLKPLEEHRVSTPIFLTTNPFKSCRKAKKVVDKMINLPVALSPWTTLLQRISTPPFVTNPDLDHFDNYEESGFD